MLLINKISAEKNSAVCQSRHCRWHCIYFWCESIVTQAFSENAMQLSCISNCIATSNEPL